MYYVIGASVPSLHRESTDSLILYYTWSCHHADVYLSLNGVILPNHGYAMIGDIGSTNNTALLCHTNKPASGSNSEGDWFAPDGTTVAGIGSTDVPGFMTNRDPMVVRLFRNTDTDPPSEGMYDCVIADNANTYRTTYVGLYNSGRGIIILCEYILEFVFAEYNIPSQGLYHYLVM